MSKGLFLSFLLLIPAAVQGQGPSPPPARTAGIMTHPMNVFRRFAGDAKPIYDFYGKLLGLKQLTTYNLGGGTSVARFQIGPTQLKFSAVVPNRQYQKGSVPEATGLRLLTFYFPSMDRVAQRFRDNGLPVPEFQPLPQSRRSSVLLKDPDGQWVEIVVAPGEPAGVYDQVDIGLVVSDIEASRRFYGEFIGLDELPPAEDHVFNTKKYSFRRGSVVVSLRSFGKPLPADTGSGGIQYVVSDVVAVENLAQLLRVKIDQPVNTLQGFGLRFVWLEDPDGITNYFAEIPAPGAAPARKP